MKRLIAGAVLLVIAAASLAQTTAHTSPSTRNSDANQTTDVREAVLRYQIATWELAASSYCVKVNDKDADESLLKRLHPLPVKAASDCRRQTPPKLPKGLVDSMVDKHTKKKAVVGIGAIHWISQSEAEVEGGYDCGSQCMAWGMYRVEWDRTRWKVTAFDVRVQS